MRTAGPRKNWARGGPVEQEAGRRLYFPLCPVGSGVRGWGESGGNNRVCEGSRSGGVVSVAVECPPASDSGILWAIFLA